MCCYAKVKFGLTNYGVPIYYLIRPDRKQTINQTYKKMTRHLIIYVNNYCNYSRRLQLSFIVVCFRFRHTHYRMAASKPTFRIKFTKLSLSIHKFLFTRIKNICRKPHFPNHFIKFRNSF